MRLASRCSRYPVCNGAASARGCWLALFLIAASAVVGGAVAIAGYVALFRAVSLYWR